MPYDNKDPKRDHNFDNNPYVYMYVGIIIFAATRILLGCLGRNNPFVLLGLLGARSDSSLCGVFFWQKVKP